MPLTGRHILITGASRGLGFAVARAAAAQGAHVIALARTVRQLEHLDDEIKKHGGTATLIPFDLTRLDDLEVLGPQLATRIPHLDGWVSGAMALGELSPIAHSKPSDYRRALDLSVMANVQMIRTLDPLLRAATQAHVVFVTDDRKDENPAYWGPYVVAKSALQALATVYANEQGTTRIKVHTFDPGQMATGLRTAACPGENKNDLPSPDKAAQKLLEQMIFQPE